MGMKELITRLTHEDPEVRFAAADELITIGAESVPPLIETINDNSPLVFNLSSPYHISVIRRDTSGFQKSVIRILGEIGDTKAIPALIELLKDKNNGVCNAAAHALVKFGDGAIEPLLKALKHINKDVREGALWALGEIGDAKAISPIVNMQDNQVRDSIQSAVEKLLEHNQPFTESFPDIFCTACFLRGMQEKIKSGAYRDHQYVFCRFCESSLHLINNVKYVIGLICGDSEEYKQDSDAVYVRLWFEDAKKARNADIDILEIRESDSISYDWAVNAVLNMLKNDVSRPRYYVKGIPVIIRGNPPLSENSIMILTHEFGGITK